MDRTEFLKRSSFTEEDYHSSGWDWALLEKIREHHVGRTEELLSAGNYILQRLQQERKVHSVKLRIKDPDHLVAKLVRKRIKNPNFIPTVETYSEQVTDLIGLRALHLFKDDWQRIHEFVIKTWNLHETPIAWIRDGDPKEVEQTFERCGCTVRMHEFGYRSVHYLLEFEPARHMLIAELQARTVFEEGWSEIDHRVRYPNISENPVLEEFLRVFNRQAGSADEMGTFVKTLKASLDEYGKDRIAAQAELAEKEKALRKAVSLLKISEGEKQGLRQKIDELGFGSDYSARKPSRGLVELLTIRKTD